MGNKMGKRLLLAGVPGILAQPLAQVFQRERWTVASLGPCGAAGVVSYDCGVMDVAARDVLAVHHIDVLVYGLLGQEEPVAALARPILRLCALHRPICSSSISITVQRRSRGRRSRAFRKNRKAAAGSCSLI